MKITLNEAGKKYYREWIFRKASINFSDNDSVVILGPNGSGKSTLLQIISGAVLPNEGTVSYSDSKEIFGDEIYKYVSLAAPYLELIEEFTLNEIISFHFKFKRSIRNFSAEEILKSTGLADKGDSIFKYFSSGMKQRVKLALAFLSDTQILLLDEPCSNLDANGIEWYKGMVRDYAKGRIVIVASNDHPEEFSFCKTKFNISDYKK